MPIPMPMSMSGMSMPTPFPNVTSTISSGSGPTSCGEIGDFVINWDDEPIYIPTATGAPPYAPVFAPYHHLFFANGWDYYTAPNNSAALPTPPEPYDPISGPNVAVFHIASVPLAQADIPDDNGMLPGQIGAGPHSSDDAFWFNAYSAEMGCDNGGASPCNMTITGYKWDDASQTEKESTQQHATIQTCTQVEDCKLDPIAFDHDFRGLSSIRFEAVIDNATVNSFIMDNLSMGWSDNSCDAGNKRVTSKKK
jgi:hypothetical protein